MRTNREVTILRVSTEDPNLIGRESELRDFAESMGWEVVKLPFGVNGLSERAEKNRVALSEIREGRRVTKSGRPIGRPRRLTPKKVRRILELRELGCSWSKVAQLVGLPVGTCRGARSPQSNAPLIWPKSSFP